MYIGFATHTMVDNLKILWKEVFGDSDEYIELYFGKRFKPENTVVYLEDNIPVSMLTLLPITVKTPIGHFPGRYIFAVATKEEYRSYGISSKLMLFADNYMINNGITMSILRPASPSLFSFYHKRGYETQFGIKRLIVRGKDMPYTKERCRIIENSLAGMEDLRESAITNRLLFVSWDKEALGFIDAENGFFAGKILLLKDDKSRKACAVCYQDETGIIVKELIIGEMDLDVVLCSIHEYFLADHYTIQMPEDSDIIDGVYAQTEPYAMVKWYNRDVKSRLQELKSEGKYKAAYIAHVMD